MSSQFGNKIDKISSNLKQPFTVSEISSVLRADTGEEDTNALDVKIRYHLDRLNTQRVGRRMSAVLFKR